MTIKVNKAYSFLYDNNLLDKYREIILYGGRASGKTTEMIVFLLIKALSERCNILCLREFAINNKYASILDFKNLLINLKIDTILQEYYSKFQGIKIYAREIYFKHNGSKIIFTGINDNTIMSIKSMSNIKYCWIDEANFLSEYSYNILKPTIRAKNSKLFYTFNPQSENDFLYKKIFEKNNLCFIKKVNWNDNYFFNETLNKDRLQDYQNMQRGLYLHIWEGHVLKLNDSQVINTDLIGFFNDLDLNKIKEVFLTIDTAYSKQENADYSVIGCFAIDDNFIYLLRIYKGKWDFNELINMLKNAYQWTLNNYKTPQVVIIEKKASGISLLQELERTTNLPLKEVVPKKDKYTRISEVLNILDKLRLPLDRENPLNSWTNDFIQELKDFRADLKHKHDDQVDVLYYALKYFKDSKGINWEDFNNFI